MDALAYRAELIDPDTPHGGERLAELRCNSALRWFDTLADQWRDFSASVRVRQDDNQFVRDAGRSMYAYYSWCGRIVRVLPESEFVALRTSRNQHKIFQAEQERLRSSVIGIVGLSVGQSVAVTMALERVCGELRLADFDVIDLSNLNRLRCGVHQLGVNKAVVAAREIAELDPYLKTVCFTQGFRECDADAFLAGVDLVVEECDSLDVKIRLRERARALRIPVLMNTSDRGMTDIERFDLEPQRDIFHGRLASRPTDALAQLTTEEKVPMVLDILGQDSISVRLRASMLEIGTSIHTWPQLASDVTLGGAIITDVARRLLLGEPVQSGRFHLDMSSIGRESGREVRNPVSPQLCAGTAPPRRACDDIDEVLADADRSPSAGNVRPWAWRRDGNCLHLGQRPTRHASVLYHRNRANLVGLGASLETACISAAHRGYRVKLADSEEDVVSMHLSRAPDGMRTPDPLFDQIAKRRSYRVRPSSPGTIDEVQLSAMRRELAAFPGVRFDVLNRPESLSELTSVVEAGERLRLLDPACHLDMIDEIRWPDAEYGSRTDGIEIGTLGLSETEAAVLGLIRDPAVLALLGGEDLGQSLGRLSGELIASSAAVGLLWSTTCDGTTFFDGGRALQRIWLRASALGIGMCPVTSICYLLGAWRDGATSTERQRQTLPALEQRFSAVFGLPAQRADIALVRMVPIRQS